MNRVLPLLNALAQILRPSNIRNANGAMNLRVEVATVIPILVFVPTNPSMRLVVPQIVTLFAIQTAIPPPANKPHVLSIPDHPFRPPFLRSLTKVSVWSTNLPNIPTWVHLPRAFLITTYGVLPALASVTTLPTVPLHRLNPLRPC